MDFIDAHHHLWDLGAVDYVWLKQIGAPKPFGDPTPIQRDYLVDEFRRDTAGSNLVGSVHVQCDAALADPVAETAWLSGVADAHRLPSAIVGFVDLSSDAAWETLARHRAFPRFRGVRQIVGRVPDRPEISFTDRDLMAEPTWRRNFARLAEHGLSFDLQLYPEQMAAAAELLAAHADVPVVIDHAGSPYDQTPAGLDAWAAGLARLAALRNVHIKVSGLGMYDRAWDATRSRAIFETILELFGTGRTMFGSNFPVDSLMRPYGFVVDQFRAWAAPLPPAGHAALLADTARRFYRLD